MAYAVVRTDNLSGIVDGSKLVTARFYNGSPLALADCQNGSILELSEIDTDANKHGERFTWKAVIPSATDSVHDTSTDGKLILVATPEMIYDKKYFNLNEYTNKAGTYLRGYVLESGDVFSVTAEGFAGSTVPAPGDTIGLSSNTLAKNGSGALAACVKLATVGGVPYYVLRVL